MSEPSLLSTPQLAIGCHRRPVPSGIGLDFEPGQFIALPESNGAGKITLRRTLSRYVKPMAGRIEILGCDLDAFIALGRCPYSDFMGRLSARDADAIRVRGVEPGLPCFCLAAASRPAKEGVSELSPAIGRLQGHRRRAAA